MIAAAIGQGIMISSRWIVSKNCFTNPVLIECALPCGSECWLFIRYSFRLRLLGMPLPCSDYNMSTIQLLFRDIQVMVRCCLMGLSSFVSHPDGGNTCSILHELRCSSSMQQLLLLYHSTKKAPLCADALHANYLSKNPS